MLTAKFYASVGSICLLPVQERPNVPVQRRRLWEELLRAAEVTGSHEDSQWREALHM